MIDDLWFLSLTLFLFRFACRVTQEALHTVARMVAYGTNIHDTSSIYFYLTSSLCEVLLISYKSPHDVFG